MTDTHAHLYDEPFAGDEAGAVSRAAAAGVSLVVLPNVNMESIGPMKRLHEACPEHTLMCMGFHPSDLGDDPSPGLDAMERELEGGGYAAVGEVGIDLHWPDSPPLELQLRAFERQLRWGVRFGLPVVIHSRDALEETLGAIENVKRDSELPVLVFHSFTGSADDVRRIRQVCDPYFGINGVVTFKNAPVLREALPVIGADRMLLETDSPYLAPVPHRGERNESAYIPLVLQACAPLLGMSPEELEQTTDDNALRIFR